MKHPKAEAAKEVVREYPGFPSRTLARMLVDKHPGLFADVEDARGFIRTYRGANGDAKRKDLPGSKHLRRGFGTTSDGVYPLPAPIEDST